MSTDLPPAAPEPPHGEDWPATSREPPASLAPTSDDRTMALLAHLGGIFTGFIVPLVIWLIKKDLSRFVDDQGKEALNFQINLMVHALILTVFGCITIGFGFFLFIPWGVYAVVMPVIAAVKSNQGEAYRYPLTVRVIQ